MKLLNLFRKADKTEKPGRFSDFFLHASEKKREEVLREAAREANKEQQEVFTKAHLKVKTQ